jgi:hypothetical protein
MNIPPEERYSPIEHLSDGEAWGFCCGLAIAVIAFVGIASGALWAIRQLAGVA